MPRPLNTEWYWPAIRSRTRRWVTISILRIRLRSSRGSMRAVSARRGRGRLRNLDALEQLAHDGLGRDVLRLRLVGQDHAVAQHVHADRLDVLGRDVAAVAQERVRARRHVEVDGRARAGAERDEVRQIGQPVRLRVAARVYDADDVVADLLVDVDLVHHPARLRDLL